jgi:hypothetical protein
MDLFENPVGSLTSLAKYRTKVRYFAIFIKEVVQKLKFPNNSNDIKKLPKKSDCLLSNLYANGIVLNNSFWREKS